jgi:hypothetical protein
MSKKGLTFLIAGFIAFLVLTLVSAGILAAVLISKNDKEKTTDTNETAETTNDTNNTDTTEVTSKDLFAVVNCKLYKLSASKVSSVALTNKTKVTCFRNKIIDTNFTLLIPTDASQIKPGVNENSLYMINLTTKSIVEIKYAKSDSHTAVYDSVSQKLYSYLIGDGVYSGTFSKPLTQKIYTSDTEVLGRGSVFGDDFGLRLSPDATKIAVIDTSSSINKDGSTYKSLKIINTTGTLIFSDDGTHAKWLTNSKLIYLNAAIPSSASGQTVIRDFSKNVTETVNGFENAYHYDVLGNYMLIDYFANTGKYNTAGLKTAVLKISDNTVVSTMTKKSENYLLDTTTVVGHSVFDCSGDSDSGAKYPCPMDWVYGFYQKNLNAHDITVNKDTTLIAYTTPELY